jgi:hypothetical protein
MHHVERYQFQNCTNDDFAEFNKRFIAADCETQVSLHLLQTTIIDYDKKNTFRLDSKNQTLHAAAYTEMTFFSQNIQIKDIHFVDRS